MRGRNVLRYMQTYRMEELELRRSRPAHAVLVAAAATCGLLWVGAALVAPAADRRARRCVALGDRRRARHRLPAALSSSASMRRLRSLAGTDALTGLANHRELSRAPRWRARPRRARATGPLALVIARPRQLQADQRHPRPPVRRRGTARRSAPRSRDGRPRQRYRGSHRRRGVRAHPPGRRLAIPRSRSPSGLARRSPRSRSPASSSRCSAGVAAYPRRRRGFRRPWSSSPTARCTGQSAAARAAPGGSTPSTRRRPGATASGPRWSSCSTLDRPITPVFQPVVSLGTGPRRRLRGAGALSGHQPGAPPTSGSPRRTAAGSGPSSRRPRSAPPWSRVGSPVRRPPGDQRQPLGARLGPVVQDALRGRPRAES